MSTSEKKLLTLKSSDDEVFKVTLSAASLSTTLRNMIEDNCTSTTIPVPNVDAKTLAMVLEFCHKHAAISESDSKDDKDVLLKVYDAEFVADLDQAVLYSLILAANYLDVKELLEVTLQRVADMIKGKTPEEIRRMFKIENDFSPEEEEEIRKQNAWAFE